MCGLVGMFGNIQGKPLYKSFRDMLFMDTVRGKDSTGIALVNSDWESFVLKAVGTPNKLIQSPNEMKKHAKFLDKTGLPSSQSHRVMIGHNRAATLGEINVLNAHPFEFSDLIGAHNGTLRDGYDKFDAYFEFKDMNDSFVLYHEMNRRVKLAGPDVDDREEAIVSTIEDVEGAMALTFFDKETRRFYMFRNYERPLHYILFKRGYVSYASEPWMIYGSHMANGVLSLDFDRKKLVQEVETRELMSFDTQQDKWDELHVGTRHVKSYARTYGYGAYGSGGVAYGGGAVVPFKDKKSTGHGVKINVPVVLHSYGDGANGKAVFVPLTQGVPDIEFSVYFTATDLSDLHKAVKHEAECTRNDSRFFFVISEFEMSKVANETVTDARWKAYTSRLNLKHMLWEEIEAEHWTFDHKDTEYTKFIRQLDDAAKKVEGKEDEEEEEEKKVGDTEYCAYCSGEVDKSKRHYRLNSDKSTVFCHNCLDSEEENILAFVPAFDLTGIN